MSEGWYKRGRLNGYPSLFNNLENGGIVRMNLNVWKRSCFQGKRPTILFNCPENTFPATSGMWTKQSFTRARVCLQLLWHFFFFLAFALGFQWSHLPQKIVETVFGKTPGEGSPGSNHKRLVSKQFNFPFVMCVTGVTGRLGVVFFSF